MGRSAHAAYRIDDEPRPGDLAHLAVRPIWPLFALMLAGGWLAWPWFLLNGAAIGSATLRREIGLVLLGVVGGALLLLLLGMGVVLLDLPDTTKPYLRVVAVTFRLGVGYVVMLAQSRSFALYEYFGGRVRNGIFVVAAGAWLGPKLLSALPPVAALVLR